MPGTPSSSYENARRPWTGRRVVLGVTGGIAAYKSIQVARDLKRLGATVDVVLSRSAQKFVAPLSFEGVTGRPALTDMWSAEGAALHLKLGREADVVCIAPATADLIARAAQGRADDLITTTLLATRAPVILCPAMNDGMFSHPQVQENLAHIRDALGYSVAGPAVGPLAVGEGVGPGRMLEPWQILEHIGRALASESPWKGRHVVVTGGPTREPLDPVRYLGNRSSGRMGYAIAQAAWRRGAEVTLVSGPTALADPQGVTVSRVETACEMFDAVRAVLPQAEVSVFSAAVADFRPLDPSAGKMKKEDTRSDLSIALTENPDVSAGTRMERRAGSVVVGFALETDDVLANAQGKLERKGFDFLVANDAGEPGAGFEVSTNRVTILSRHGEPEALPLMSKDEVAEHILDRVTPHLDGGS